MTTFGTSAPGSKVYEHFGITAENIVAKATSLVEYYSNRAVPVKIESFSF